MSRLADHRPVTPKLRPGKAQKILRRAFDAHKRGDLWIALRGYQRVLTDYPTNPVALHYAALVGRHINNHARATGQRTRDDEVRRLMAFSVAAAPTNAAGIHNFAKFEHDVGNLEMARDLYGKAVELAPDQGESWTNLGNVWGELGNRLRAETCWRRALECPTGAADGRYNLAFLRLQKGDYARGWLDYEARWGCPEFQYSYGRSDLTAPRWDGSRVDALYLHGEQGAGDVIMMARYVPLCEARVDRVIVEVIAGLVPLFRAMFPQLEIVAKGDEPPAHSAQLAMLSLPALFRTLLDTVPPPVAFWPNDAKGRPIQPEPGRIGLCWRGSTTHTNDRVRSMPFEACFPLLDVPGLAWQSLQFGYETSAPLDACPTGDFLDTARAIARCSLVITVDTSVAHLAASIGVETWILLPFSAEWRWLEHRSDSPWYPRAKLWRQSVAGDWRELATRVSNALRDHFPSET